MNKATGKIIDNVTTAFQCDIVQGNITGLPVCHHTDPFQIIRVTQTPGVFILMKTKAQQDFSGFLIASRRKLYQGRYGCPGDRVCKLIQFFIHTPPRNKRSVII